LGFGACLAQRRAQLSGGKLVGIVTVVVWLCTAGAGLYLLAVWLIEYDRDFQTAAATRLPIPVIGSHALLAVTGLVVYSAYLLVDNDRLVWISAAILAVVAALGLTMAARWLGVYRATSAVPATPGARQSVITAAGTVPPERHFPVTVVIIHGIFAVATLALVLLAALRS
jgi:hypothetical protein